MDRYAGATCPYCGKPFFDGDDIVVCPDCGAPHHRACWNEHHACAFAAKHAEGHVWQAPEPKTEPATVPHDEADVKICPKCGSSNPASCDYCETCGSPLVLRESPYSPPLEPVKDDDLIGDIPAHDFAVYVGDNAGYFLPRFKVFSRGRVIDWNWSAFIFSYFYLFYRKMYAFGALVLFGTIVLSLPSAALYLVDYQNLMIERGLLDKMFFTLSNPDAAMTFSNIAWILLWVLRGFVMFCTNRLYYTHALDQIHRIREHGFTNEVEYSAELVSKGRTNRMLVTIICVGFIAFYVIVTFAAMAMNVSLF